jgi:hypothetical protein
MTVFSILALIPSFVEYNGKIFLPEWSAQRAVEDSIVKTIFRERFVFVVDDS